MRIQRQTKLSQKNIIVLLALLLLLIGFLFSILYLILSLIYVDNTTLKPIISLKVFQEHLAQEGVNVDKNNSNSNSNNKNKNKNNINNINNKNNDKEPLEEVETRKQDVQWRQHPDAKDTVAFAVTLTDCSIGDGSIPFYIADGAAVLKYTIHQNSIHNNEVSGGRYDYRMYAIYHPEAAKCAPVLEELGYELLERKFPVTIEEIKGEFLRTQIHNNGCCGERELIKLVSFTLTQHTLVVLLDLDIVLLKPLDYLFDMMLTKNPPPNDHLMKPNDALPDQIDLLYTIDYAMVNPARKVKPVQGGFVVLRPNQTIFNDYVDIVREGDFREDGGWGGQTRKFWGAMTFQGLIPYYFHVLNPGRAVEINWCLYDNMCSPSRTKPIKIGAIGKCYTQQENCEDCRDRPAQDVYLFHFTVCMKPWTCQLHKRESKESRLCRDMNKAWFKARSEMEISWGRSGLGPGNYDQDYFYGYCSRHGHKGYSSIEKPYHSS